VNVIKYRASSCLLQFVACAFQPFHRVGVAGRALREPISHVARRADPGRGIPSVGGNGEALLAAEEDSRPNVALFRKTFPAERNGQRWAIMCARGELFCGEGRRASRVGHRRHVDESRAAGKPRQALRGRRRRRTSTGIVCVGEEREREREKERERGEAQTGRKTEEDRVEDIRVLSGVSIYFASNLHVSPRVSSLFRAQHSCGTSAFAISPLSLSLSRAPRFRSAYHRRDGPQTNA